jgi:hypothetical protein
MSSKDGMLTLLTKWYIDASLGSGKGCIVSSSVVYCGSVCYLPYVNILYKRDGAVEAWAHCGLCQSGCIATETVKTYPCTIPGKRRGVPNVVKGVII